jgi:hypothetical protein
VEGRRHNETQARKAGARHINVAMGKKVISSGLPKSCPRILPWVGAAKLGHKSVRHITATNREE